jgi:hypothetical protein
MKNLITTLVAMLLLATGVQAQFARLQVIHNAPDQAVDVYLNGVLALNDFAFRSATPFLNVPAGVSLTIAIAPASSVSAADAFFSETQTLQNGSTYAVTACGIEGDPVTPFTLVIDANALEGSPDPTKTDLNVLHGAPDAPAVDVVVRTGGKIVSNLAYGSFTPYLSVDPGVYYLDVKPAGGNAIVGTFKADLTTLAGGAVRVFASGLLNGTPGFGLFAALASGDVIELPLTPVARVQVIHNSPDPIVDVYANGALLLDDFEYFTASPFVFVPAGTGVNIGIALDNSISVEDTLVNVKADLLNGSTYVIVANGIVGDPNAPFELVINDNAREAASDTAKVDITVFHGSPDAPAVDIDAIFVANNAITNLAYGSFGPGYLGLDPEINDFAVRVAGTGDAVNTYRADLGTQKGKAVTVFAGGFLAGTPNFGLFAVLTDGTILPLGITPTARLQVIHNSPAPTVDVYAGSVLLIDNFAFRTATPYIDVPADRSIKIAVAPGNSASVADAIATIPVSPQAGKVYAAFAGGIVGNAGTPFALFVDESRETAIDPDNVEFNVHHGSPDAPPVEVGIAGIGNVISDIAYGAFSPYFSLAPATYQIEVKPTGSPDAPDVFIANLSGLNGAAARVFAGGLASGTPDFGLFAALADGSVIEFPRQKGPARVQIIHNAPDQTVDVYANGTLVANDLAFRTATPFTDISGGANEIAVAPANSSSAADAFATFQLTLEPEFTYVVTAVGVAGGSPAFDLVVNTDGLEQAVSAAKVDISVVHGAPDAPAVDVDAVFVADNVVSNLAYGAFTPYLSLDPDKYDFAIRANGSANVVASYRADLSALAGGAATVFASGYLGSTPAFGLFAAFPDGTVAELPITPLARVQVVHNAPEPTVDVYAGNTLLLDNFVFRTATPYVEVPADRTFSVNVAPETSASAADAIASFPVSFETGKLYQVFASGLVGGSPAFNLLADEARGVAQNPAKVEFSTHHGAPGAPAVDVSVFGAGPIASNLNYGDFSNYLAVDPGSYLVQVKLAGTNTVVGTYQADLSGLTGAAARVFASGIVGGMPGFGLFAVLADGTVIEFPQVANPSSARLQVIHNSPSPTVDVYVNGDLLLDDFTFRTATPFIDVLANVPLSIAVAPGNSGSVADAIATFPVTFAEGETYIVTASGILGDPTTPFALITNTNGRETSNVPGRVDVAVLHGAPDAPAVDVDAVFLADNVVENLPYGQFTPYLSFDPVIYDLAVRANGTTTPVATYRADLSGLADGAAYVFASGLLGGAPAFGLFAALADGTVIEFPLTPTTRVQVVHNSPTPTVDVYAGNTLLLDNFEFRTATPFVDIPADRDIEIGIAPDNSTSSGDAIATFTANFATGNTYMVMAAGVVGSTDKPFSLYIDDQARETTAPGFTTLGAFHGLFTTFDLNLDLSERLIGALYDDLTFGTFTPYIDLADGDYFIDITETGTTDLLGTHYIDPALFAGKAARLFTSGILGGDPAYGLFAVFADGSVVELPYTPVARVQVIHNSPSPTVDVYAGDLLLIDDFEFRTATPFFYVPAEVQIDLGVAPGSSQSSADVIATFPVTFDNRKTYVAVASGIVGGTPGFDLIVNDMGRERALDDTQLELAILHGAPGAPDVDITPLGGSTPLVANLQYGEFTGYLGLNPDVLLLELTPSGLPNQPVGIWGGDFTGLGGLVGIVFATGLIDDDPEFDLWVALPDGTTFPLPSFAKVQVIHNAPSPTVDVYLDDVQVLDNFAFHEATGIGLFPARTPFTLSVAPGTSTSVGDAIYALPVDQLITGKTYIIMAAGVVGGTPGFGLFINENGRERAFNSANVEASLFHGSLDAPDVDVQVQGGPVLFDNVTFGEFADYVSVAPAAYTIQVTPADDNNAIVKTYNADLSTLTGQAITVFASGYLTGQPGFQAWVAETDGDTYPLEEIVKTNELDDILGNFGISPNPAFDNLLVRFNLSGSEALRYGIRDVAGRLMLEGDFGTVNAGAFAQQIDLGRLPSGMYQLEIVSDAGLRVMKFAVQR